MICNYPRETEIFSGSRGLSDPLCDFLKCFYSPRGGVGKKIKVLSFGGGSRGLSDSFLRDRFYFLPLYSHTSWREL